MKAEKRVQLVEDIIEQLMILLDPEEECQSIDVPYEWTASIHAALLNGGMKGWALKVLDGSLQEIVRAMEQRSSPEETTV